MVVWEQAPTGAIPRPCYRLVADHWTIRAVRVEALVHRNARMVVTCDHQVVGHGGRQSRRVQVRVDIENSPNWVPVFSKMLALLLALTGIGNDYGVVKASCIFDLG